MTGSIFPKQQRYGRLPKWTEYADKLAQLVRESPDITLEELKGKLPIELSVPTVWRALKSLGLSLKKKS
jgi:transposase